MLRLRKNLPSDGSWRREALGIWDSDQQGTRAIEAGTWDATAVDVAPADGVPAFGVAFSRDGMRLSLGGAFKHDDGVHLELIDAFAGSVDAGLAPLVDWFVQKNADGVPRWRRASGIVLGGAAGASVLKQLLVEKRVPEKRIHIANTPQYLAACGMLDDSVKAKTVTHLSSDGQAALDEAVGVVDKDKRGGWVATTADGDETPVEAISLALWGARTTKRKARDESKPRGVIL